MNDHKRISGLLSAVSLLLGLGATAAPLTKELPPAPLKVEFDAQGRTGVSDSALLKKMGFGQRGKDQAQAKYDLRLPKAVRVSGSETNVVC